MIQKERRKFSELKVGDIVYCLNLQTHVLNIVNIIKIDNLEGRYFLSGPAYYSYPEINYVHGEISHICNQDEIVFSNKEAVIDYIKDTTKKLKDTKVHLRKLKLK